MKKKKTKAFKELFLKPTHTPGSSDTPELSKIESRPVVCVSCSHTFNSDDGQQFKSKFPERVLIKCPTCYYFQNIKKKLTIGKINYESDIN